MRDRKKNLRLLRAVLKISYHYHLSYLFLVGNDSKLVQVKQVHYKKLHVLGNNSSIGKHDPDKIIFNYSSHNLSNNKKMY